MIDNKFIQNEENKDEKNTNACGNIKVDNFKIPLRVKRNRSEISSQINCAKLSKHMTFKSLYKAK